MAGFSYHPLSRFLGPQQQEKPARDIAPAFLIVVA
jgi:hypothetical protein